jgi:hypothetical protein
VPNDPEGWLSHGLVDGVLAAENGPLDAMPTDEEIRDVLRAHGFR